MSKAIQAVVGLVEIVAGAVLWETPFGAPLIMAGVGQLLGYAISLLINPHRTPLIPIGAAYAGTLEPLANAPATAEELLARYRGKLSAL
jgi:hypothetical protein